MRVRSQRRRHRSERRDSGDPAELVGRATAAVYHQVLQTGFHQSPKPSALALEDPIKFLE